MQVHNMVSEHQPSSELRGATCNNGSLGSLGTLLSLPVCVAAAGCIVVETSIVPLLFVVNGAAIRFLICGLPANSGGATCNSSSLRRIGTSCGVIEVHADDVDVDLAVEEIHGPTCMQAVDIDVHGGEIEGGPGG